MEPNKAYGVAAIVAPDTRDKAVAALVGVLRGRLSDLPDDAAGRIEVAVRWVPAPASCSTYDGEMRAAMSGARPEP